MSAPRGAHLLFFSQLVVLAGVLIQALFFQVLIPKFGVGDALNLLRWSGSLWVLLNLFELVAIAVFVSGRPAGERSWAVAAIVLSGIGLLDTVGMLLVDAAGLQVERGAGWNVPMLLAGLGFEVCLWLAAARAQGRGLGGGGVLYLVLCALGAAASIAFTVAGPSWYRELPLGVIELMGWVRLALVIARIGLLLGLLFPLAFRFTGAAHAPAPRDPASSATRDLLVGAAWLASGAVATLASYTLASSGVGGGRYVITTGAIAYGLVRLIRGLARTGSATG